MGCYQINTLLSHYSPIRLRECISYSFLPFLSHVLSFCLKHFVKPALGPTCSYISLWHLRIPCRKEATSVSPLNRRLSITTASHGAEQVIINLIKQPIRNILFNLPFNTKHELLFSLDLFLNHTSPDLLLLLCQTLRRLTLLYFLILALTFFLTKSLLLQRQLLEFLPFPG